MSETKWVLTDIPHTPTPEEFDLFVLDDVEVLITDVVVNFVKTLQKSDRSGLSETGKIDIKNKITENSKKIIEVVKRAYVRGEAQ